MVIILGKKIESDFETRHKIESSVNKAYGLEGLDRRSLYYFLNKFYGDLGEDKSDTIPAFVLKEILLEIAPNTDFKKIKANEYQDISDAIGVLMVECYSGGELAKKLLAVLSTIRLRRKKTKNLVRPS